MFCVLYGVWDSNPYSCNNREILSLLRLPIPPTPHKAAQNLDYCVSCCYLLLRGKNYRLRVSKLTLLLLTSHKGKSHQCCCDYCLNHVRFAFVSAGTLYHLFSLSQDFFVDFSQKIERKFNFLSILFEKCVAQDISTQEKRQYKVYYRVEHVV